MLVRMSRLDRLEALLGAEGLDGLLVNGLTNQRYLCGYVGHASHLLVGAGGRFLVTDYRYAEIARECCHDVEIVIRDRLTTTLAEELGRLFAAAGVQRVGFEATRVSYAEHARMVASTAKALRELHGIQPGDRVAILAANCPEWVVAYWATVSLGAVVSALNGWWTRDEIVHGVELSEPKLLIGDRKRLERAEGVDLGVPILEIESEFEKLLAFDPEAALPDQPIDEDAPAVILFTSGTTGRPKGAVNSHRGILGFVQVAMLSGLRMMMLAAANGSRRA